MILHRHFANGVVLMVSLHIYQVRGINRAREHFGQCRKLYVKTGIYRNLLLLL